MGIVPRDGGTVPFIGAGALGEPMAARRAEWSAALEARGPAVDLTEITAFLEVRAGVQLAMQRECSDY